MARGETVSIMEITMRNLMREGEVDSSDFLSRADVLAATGQTVMISDFSEYYRLAAYLFRYTSRRIGLAMGAMNLREIFDETHYANLDGGILETFGRLFKNNLKLFVYPYIDQQHARARHDRQARARPALRQLYGYLVERRCIVQLTNINQAYLNIYSPDVLSKINAKSTEWESMVPPEVARAIKSRGLFGYN